MVAAPGAPESQYHAAMPTTAEEGDDWRKLVQLQQEAGVEVEEVGSRRRWRWRHKWEEEHAGGGHGDGGGLRVEEMELGVEVGVEEMEEVGVDELGWRRRRIPVEEGTGWRWWT